MVQMPDPTSLQLSDERLANVRSTTIALTGTLAIAFLLGGGGSKFGFANLAVQLAALVALFFHKEAFFRFWSTAPLGLRLLAAVSAVLPLLYLVPLPPSLWSGLPGRELLTQAFDLAGGKTWASISVDPIRTALALSALIVPLAVITIGWNAPRDRLILAGWLTVGIALVNLFIGIPQTMLPGQDWLLYPQNDMQRVLFGTFANRNSTGLFLVGALALAVSLPLPARLAQGEIVVRLGVCVLLIVAIILTRSRTAFVLATLPIGLGFLQFAASQMRKNVRTGMQRYMGIIVGGVIVLLAAILVVAAPGRVNDVIERFEKTDEARNYIWEDASYSAQRYWPVGTGTGTFDDVYQLDESLETMGPRRAGRAHNDYLEVAIETGIAGICIIAGWLILLCWLAWRARKSPDRWISWSAGVGLLAIALQSITDYPLRNLSMLAFAGLALVILTRFGTPPAYSPSRMGEQS